MLLESQAGFRKGRSTMDNIFILNHLVQRSKLREDRKEKVYALFVDLKAAFDKVDREILIDLLKEKGINKKIIENIEMIYR